MFKNALNFQNTPINAANRALGPYINILKSARRLLQSQITQVASWPDWQSICTCCYRNGDDRHHSAVQRAEIQRYCRYYIPIAYTYTNYHRCAPEIPSSPNSIQTSSILHHLYFEQALCTVKIFLFPWEANSLVFPFLPPLQHYTPFPEHYAQRDMEPYPALSKVPRVIYPAERPGPAHSRPEQITKQNLQSRNTVVQLTKSGRESLYNRVA